MLAASAALLVAALAATGCVSMPTGGPVTPYPVTQGTQAQNQPYVQIQPQQPGRNWTPTQIVEGFLTASASYVNYPQVAQAYLTPAEQTAWDPYWSAVVYKSSPGVTELPGSSSVKNQTATVKVTGTIEAQLQGNGAYFVPSGGLSGIPPQPFTLVKVGTQWRISVAPQELLLTSNSFDSDYQLRNLYFFDLQKNSLVPDPVYVPVLQNPGDLMKRLVDELISPPNDWVTGATETAFPGGTKGTEVNGVTLEGVTAVVNLTGPAIAKAYNDTATMEKVSAQLLWTLSVNASSGSNGQGVQSVEVVVNSKQWTPPKGQDNAVQPKQSAVLSPANGESKEFYYLTSDGYLASETPGQKPVSVAKIGVGYTQIAVSADGKYLAALRGSTLYTGLIDGPLAKRGSGIVAMSWDASDDLLASASQGQQIVMFRDTPGSGQLPAQRVTVDAPGPFTALRVAPDGVRVALVLTGADLTFGAISWSRTGPKITISDVLETPPTQGQSDSAAVNFTALSWYGPDNIIALAGPQASPTVTEYPVSGGTPTPLQSVPHMLTIAASLGEPLIAGLANGRMSTDANPSGSWTRIDDGNTPASGSSPTYPN